MRRNAAKEYRETILYYLINRDGLNCTYCDKPLGIDIQISHMKAVALGGKNRMENLGLSHWLCNYEDSRKLRGKKFRYNASNGQQLKWGDGVAEWWKHPMRVENV